MFKCSSNMEKRQYLHITIYCTAISPCGKYLAVGSNYGVISVFDIANVLSPNALEGSKKPLCIFKAHPGPVHALKTVEKLLVSAGYGPVVGWRWADVINGKPSKAFSVSAENSNAIASYCESYNCLCYNSKNNVLYTGGNDSNTLAWDLKSGKCCETFSGHSAYIHDLDMASGTLVSSSEDGCVKVWDVRNAQCTKTFEPHKNSKLERSQIGKWISCVCIDSNSQWMACGGGPHASLWHLRSGNLISILPDNLKGSSKGNKHFLPNTITFFDGEIIAAGNRPNIYRWHLNGRSKAIIPCTVKNVFDIGFRLSQSDEERSLPMAVGGNGPQINLFTNLGYLGASLCVI